MEPLTVPMTVAHDVEKSMVDIKAPEYHDGRLGKATASGIDEDALLRKIDWKIMPIMLACYILQFVDKVAINYSAVMGMQTDLKMSATQFSWMATAFFISYTVCEIPQAMLLQKYPVNWVLGCNVLVWGITVSCMAAAQNVAGLTTLRVLLGISEGVIAPSLILVTSMWYKRKESSVRYGIWYSGLGIGQIFGGLMSFAFQNVSNTSFQSWRAMFVTLGGITLIVGALTIYILPANPETAKFLTEEERKVVLSRVSENQTGIEDREFATYQFVEAITDVQVWLLVLLTIVTSMPSGAISTFSSTIIKGFGYTSKQSALLGMPSGIVSIFSIILSTWVVTRGMTRWTSILVLLIPTIIGGGLMGFLPAKNQGGLLAGIYLINFAVAPVAVVYSWCGANFGGYTKKITANAMVQAGFGIGNIIGPQTFQARDLAGGYIPAKITIMAAEVAAGFITVLIFVIYRSRNHRTLKTARVNDGVGQNVTDKENKSFVYVY